MKKSNLIWGLVLITLGVVFGLNALNITKINIFFTGWWTLFIIIPSFAGLLDEKNKKGSFITLIIGIVLLLAARGIIDFAIVGRLIVPIVLVLLGFLLILKKEDKDYIAKEDLNYEEEVAVTFSEQTVNIDKDFTDKSASAVFGKLTLDLSNAKFKKNANIKLEAVFGSITLILPEGYDVKLKSTPIFGSINNTYNSSGSKELFIDADAIFGSVTIK